LQDIRLILRKFNEKIEDRYTTQEEILEVFARKAGESSLIKGAHIYLDGFTGFTPVQYKLLEQLARYAADLTFALTLPGDRVSEDVSVQDQFSLSNRTICKLKDIADRTGTEVYIRTVGTESRIPDLYVYNAADIRSETEFIAAQILDGVRNHGMRFRDFAVVACDIESCHNVVKKIFREAGISCFVDYKSELGSNSLARFIVASLQLIIERFSFNSMFAYLKSGMTALTFDEICILENYCLEFGISNFRRWKEPFKRNRKTQKGEFWDLDKMNMLRSKAMNHLEEFHSACKLTKSHCADEYVSAIKKLMSDCAVGDRMREKAEEFCLAGDMVRCKEYEKIYNDVTELLDQISRLMGNDILKPREFSTILTGALDELKVDIIPPSLDAVVVGDLTRTRFDNVKVMFIAGANEGKLPSAPGASGLITQWEREFLKDADFELAPTVLEDLYSQHFYIYLLSGKASERIYMTYPSMNGAGESLQPSPVLINPEDIIPGIRTEHIEKGSEETWKRRAAGRLAEKMSTLVPDKAGEELQKLIRYFALEDMDVLSRITAGRLFSNRTLPLDSRVALDLYGGKLKGSVSRYENFYGCPFSHFLNYGLNLSERPEYKAEATDTGTIYHDTLEKYAMKLKEKDLTFRTVSDDESHAIVWECMNEAVRDLGKDVMTDTHRSRFMLERMYRITEKTTDVLRQQVKDGLFEPSEFELPFNTAADDGPEFRGRIDRVDIYDAGDIYVRVIDYKSGKKKFDIKDIYTGQQLQLAAYLDAAMTAVREKYPDRNVRAGGVYYYLIHDHFIREEDEAYKRFRMSGLTNCEQEVLKATDGNAGPGTPSRIVEVSYSNNGLVGSSKVANDTELGNLMAFVKKKISDVSKRLMEGDVSISPSCRDAQNNACSYCEYMNICKFEPGKWGTDYSKPAEGLDNKDIEREIYGRI
ncbi:MAG: PD-(D/E)XK nuclease family protein, partial [Parasporobacterium sp.]|nr:PD-(D/E)XK nuclease family protein [Parasporobacterium sp.]